MSRQPRSVLPPQRPLSFISAATGVPPPLPLMDAIKRIIRFKGDPNTVMRDRADVWYECAFSESLISPEEMMDVIIARKATDKALIPQKRAISECVMLVKESKCCPKMVLADMIETRPGLLNSLFSVMEGSLQIVKERVIHKALSDLSESSVSSPPSASQPEPHKAPESPKAPESFTTPIESKPWGETDDESDKKPEKKHPIAPYHAKHTKARCEKGGTVSGIPVTAPISTARDSRRTGFRTRTSCGQFIASICLSLGIVVNMILPPGEKDNFLGVDSNGNPIGGNRVKVKGLDYGLIVCLRPKPGYVFARGPNGWLIFYRPNLGSKFTLQDPEYAARNYYGREDRPSGFSRDPNDDYNVSDYYNRH